MEDLRPILTSPYDYVISDPKWIQTGIFKTTHVYQLAVNNYILTDYPWVVLGGVGPRGWRIFFLTSTRWLPMYENQNPATISRQKCYQMYLWLFQTSKMNFLLNDAFFYWSVPKVVYWWVEKHITRSVSGNWCLQSYPVMTPYMGYQCLN